MGVKLKIVVTDGLYEIEDLPEDDALALTEDIEQGDSNFLTFTLDAAIVKVARAHIIAVEID